MEMQGLRGRFCLTIEGPNISAEHRNLTWQEATEKLAKVPTFYVTRVTILPENSPEEEKA